MTIKYKFALCDDDELVRLMWSIEAKKQKVEILITKTSIELLDNLNNLDNDVKIYIDVELENGIKGFMIAKELKKKLPQIKIILTTGHTPENFEHMSWIDGVITKTPPFFSSVQNL